MRRLPKFPSLCSLQSGSLMSTSWDTFVPGAPRVDLIPCEVVVRWEQIAGDLGGIQINRSNMQNYRGPAIAIYLPIGTDVRDFGNTLTWSDCIQVQTGYNFYVYSAFPVNTGFPEEFICAMCQMQSSDHMV